MDSTGLGRLFRFVDTDELLAASELVLLPTLAKGETTVSPELHKYRIQLAITIMKIYIYIKLFIAQKKKLYYVRL